MSPFPSIHRTFVGLLLIVAAAILFFFHTRTAEREVSQLQMDYEKTREETSALLEKQDASPLTTSISEVEKRELVASIPETMDQAGIIADLNRTAKTAEVSLNVITFSRDTADSLPAVNSAVGVNGALPNVLRFLKLIEVNPRKLVIRDAAIARTETVAGLHLVNVNLTIRAFYQKES